MACHGKGTWACKNRSRSGTLVAQERGQWPEHDRPSETMWEDSHNAVPTPRTNTPPPKQTPMHAARHTTPNTARARPTTSH